MERELNEIFSHGPVVVFRWGNEPGWPVEFATPNVFEVLGYTPEEFQGRGLLYESLVHPEDLPRVQREVAEHSRSKATYFHHEPYRVLARNGEVLHVSDLTHIVRGEGKGILHYIGYICDISKELSDQRELEKKLRLSEERYRAIYNRAPVGIFRSTRSGRFLDVNPALAEMLGYGSPQDVLDNVDNISRRIYPKPVERSRLVDRAIGLMGQGEFVHVENRYYRKDGSDFHANLYLRAVADDNGGFDHLFGIVEDISERKQNELELRRQKEKYHNLYQNAPLPYQSLDREGCILEINPAWSETTGYSYEEAVGREFVTLLLEKDREAFAANFAKAQKGEKVPPAEYHLRTRDGGELIIHFQGCAIYSESGGFLYSNCLFYDITRQRQAEKALAQSEKKLREIFDNMSNGCAILEARDNGQRFVFKDFNTAACAMDDVIREQVLGKEIREAFPMVEEFGLFAVLQEVYSTGEPKQHPISFYQDNRLSGWRENFVFRLSTGEIISFYQDMTPIKKREQELRDSNATKDKFFSIIAHDLRGPITGFLQLTELMMERWENYSTDELYEMIRSMHSSSAELNKLLNNLLDWSRLQQGKTEARFRKLSLDEVIYSVVNLNQETFRAKGLQVKVELLPLSASDGITITADEQMLHAIVRNLVNNAIKFSYQGGAIEIVAEEKREQVVISVMDHGTGIPQSKQEEIFCLDHQTGSTGTGGERGTGLGLVLCREYVQRHSGGIRLESREGQGSTFFVELPRTP